MFFFNPVFLAILLQRNDYSFHEQALKIICHFLGHVCIYFSLYSIMMPYQPYTLPCRRLICSGNLQRVDYVKLNKVNRVKCIDILSVTSYFFIYIFFFLHCGHSITLYAIIIITCHYYVTLFLNFPRFFPAFAASCSRHADSACGRSADGDRWGRAGSTVGCGRPAAWTCSLAHVLPGR